MKKSRKTILQGLVPFAILIFFLAAAYEARTIYQGDVDPNVTRALKQHMYYQKHIECLATIRDLQKVDITSLKRDVKKTSAKVNEIKSCQEHSGEWASLSEEDREFLIKHTNTEAQDQYLRQAYAAATTLLAKDHDRESGAFQSALVILKMEIPKTHLKKGIGPLSLMFLFGLLIMFVLFRKDPDAQKIRNDGRIFGISYKDLSPFRRNKEGK